MTTLTHPTQSDLKWFLNQSRPRRMRSMRMFAEQEIVIPTGPYAGRRFKCNRQPYSGLWFDAVDSGRWSRHIATGPTQSGKSLSCFVIPLLYHLFEVGETVICGLPDMDMAADKWREDLLPVIERSRYKHLLPASGGGSRGGRVESLQMRNGATLKFMSGGGSDKSRAGFTSRVLVVTETDGLDTSAAGSREADKIKQLEARTRAYGNRKRIYMECTVSTEQGRTWQEYSLGTKSRIVLKCHACEAWVTPEREHLVGWQGCESRVEASEKASFVCPSCGVVWDESQRIEAHSAAKLVHGDQVVGVDDTLHGDAPATDTLGFRWSAINNLFTTTQELAADEWRAQRSVDEDNAEREQRQFVWCLPVTPRKLAQISLEAHELAGRMIDLPKGIIPAEAQYFTAGIDLGKYLAHWVVVAWSARACGHIVEYGRLEVPSDSMGVEQALMITLREFRELVKAGWPMGTAEGVRKSPNLVFADSGYMAPVVYAFCRETGEPFRPAVGRGASQQHKQYYNRPTQGGSMVNWIGEGAHAVWIAAEQVQLVEMDADHWKTWVHQRLSTPLGSPGAMTLYRAPAQDHLALAKHLTAEVKTEEFVAGKGVVTKWERIRKQNHWFDALYNSCVAGYGAGVRLVDEVVSPPPPPVQWKNENWSPFTSEESKERWRSWAREPKRW